MGLSAQDFVTAFRAISTRACSPSAVRKALRVQSSRMEKGKLLTLAESLVEAHSVSPARAQELSSAAPVDLRGDPEALTETGELFLSTESASEIELDRIVDSLTHPPDPRTLKEVPVPASLGGYDISWEVGRSRTGSVYRGSKRGLPVPVAIKVFRKEVFASDAARAAFLERMSAAPSQDGAGLIKVHEAREVDGHAVVVQDFIEGVPLERLIAERKVSLRRGFEIVGRAAALVAPHHGRGVAHGRLSARGIMVQPNDRPMIDGPHHPEGATAADDVAVLGAVLYEIAAGAPPYGGFRSHELKPPTRHNPSCDADAEKIILKALARDPARRYPDAGALAEDIGRFLRHEPVTADVSVSEAAPPSRAVPRKARRWAWKAGVAAAAILILMGVLAVLNSGQNPSPPAGPPAVVTTPPVEPPVSPPAAPPAPPPRADTRLRDLAAKGPLSDQQDFDYRFRAQRLMTERNFDDLDRVAEEALVRGPERGWGHYYRAWVALERGDHEKALKHADRALALGAGELPLLDLRFDIRLARAEYRGALEELARLYPKDSTSTVNQEFRRLKAQIDTDPGYAEPYVRRGALYLHRKQTRRAIEDFSRAITAGESRAHYFMALALKEDERTAEAADAARRFLASHGDLPGAVEAREFLESLPQ